MPYDRRNLNIGDFLWVARERLVPLVGQFTQPEPRELVLPYIVERKRLGQPQRYVFILYFYLCCSSDPPHLNKLCPRNGTVKS